VGTAAIGPRWGGGALCSDFSVGSESDPFLANAGDGSRLLTRTLTFAPAGDQLASIGEDGIRLWSLAPAAQISALPGIPATDFHAG